MRAGELPLDWQLALAEDLASVDLTGLLARVAREREASTVFPPADEVFSAFQLTPFEKTRVLVLGQDPYHGERQGHGLAFSVKPGVKPPPSLVNIFKELERDVGCAIPATGHLAAWAQQGVLMLNTVLTVRSGEPNSHKGLGWEAFTDAVIKALSRKRDCLVAVLWGTHARKKAKLIDSRHTVIEGAHPSPLSVKQFIGSRPFSKVNDALEARGQAPIDWQIA
ncbi:MAG: uracil-DNA glycosylase [Myxococcales bacterium]|nr:uracil-DNA glycosylase [Myxococcales bacterium]